MTDLSPAAQAVMDAANGASSWGPDDCLNDAREIAAAALRALVTYGEAVEIRTAPGMAEFDEVIRASDLLAIADELEGAQ